MEKDSRNLPADWAALHTIPPGTTACHEKSDDNAPPLDTKYKRRFEVGSSQRDGYESWRQTIVAGGWKIATKDGHRLSIFVSGDVDKFAWSTVEFYPKETGLHSPDNFP